jgi:hypothetical protein
MGLKRRPAVARGMPLPGRDRAAAFARWWLPRTYHRLAGGGPAKVYSQHGEDLVLANMLGAPDGRLYVDLGCGHPLLGSDTYLLYRRGWHGLVVDGDPRYARVYRRVRPRDTFVPAIVTADARPVRFSDAHHRSSASPDWHAATGPDAPIEERGSVAVQDLLDRHVPRGARVGLLKVDVENLDSEVLLAIDLERLAPDAVMVEMTCFWSDDVAGRQVSRHLADQGYGCVYHNFVNDIFIRRPEAGEEAARVFRRYADAQPFVAVARAADARAVAAFAPAGKPPR